MLRLREINWGQKEKKLQSAGTRNRQTTNLRKNGATHYQPARAATVRAMPSSGRDEDPNKCVLASGGPGLACGPNCGAAQCSGRSAVRVLLVWSARRGPWDERGTSQRRKPTTGGENRSRDRVRHNPPESEKFEGNVEGEGAGLGRRLRERVQEDREGEKKRSARRDGRRWKMDGRLVRKR
jgi:hypothetical protein